MLAGLFVEIRAMRSKKHDAAVLLITWVFLVLLSFTPVQTRYPRYIMPVYPAFAILAAIALERSIPPVCRKAFFNLVCVVGCVAIGGILLFPPKQRATDMDALVPLAEENTSPHERVIIYSYEDGRSDYLNQFLWYSSRYAELPSDLSELAARLTVSRNAVFIIDKRSYERLPQYSSPETLLRARIVGHSENFLCLKVP